jgi:Nucleotide exchange factor Fes1
MADEVKHHAPSASLEERREQLAQLLEESKMWPTQAEVMNTSLSIAANVSEEMGTRVNALRMVQELAEDIDVANGVTVSAMCARDSTGVSRYA